MSIFSWGQSKLSDDKVRGDQNRFKRRKKKAKAARKARRRNR